MKSYGNLDLRGNMLLDPVLQQVENFPATPQVGRLIFKGGRVMICIEIDAGLPVWAPLTAQLNTYIHDQSVAAMTWTINHNLNTSNPIVQVVDPDGKHIIPDEITNLHNQTVITFASNQTGRAVLMLGSESGSPRENYAFEQDFTDTDTWVINHQLGYNPVIRVFIGNQEVQPLAIVHDSLNQATVTFSSPQTGHVRCL